MIATEKYIEKDTGFIVEIEQEDNQKWVWIYRPEYWALNKILDAIGQ